ncbi:MAG TPA: IS5 family transposase [Candidatus Nanoarchaeia archaeon]|nr:IS5 family transposase [Candidatus Nanoarchaeia archaeon]
MRSYSLKQFGTSLSYKRVEKLGDRLEPISRLVDWEEFRKFFERVKNKVGRPPYDPVLMVKVLVLQSWYGISDEEIEYQVADRISFQKFLGFPNEIPDYSTIWRFREALAGDNIIDEIWDELHRQMEEKGIKTSKGVMQDAAFVVAAPGKTNSGMNDRGKGQPSARNEDGSWGKKGSKSYFGYKKHIKTCLKTGIIKTVGVTTASTADCNLDLANPDEVVYRDRGYSGKTKAKGNATMKKASKNKKLSPKEWLRNKRIMRKKAPGERPFAVMHNVMNGGKTLLTELYRVFAQQVMCCFTYNLIQMRRLLST